MSKSNIYKNQDLCILQKQQIIYFNCCQNCSQSKPMMKIFTQAKKNIYICHSLQLYLRSPFTHRYNFCSNKGKTFKNKQTQEQQFNKRKEVQFRRNAMQQLQIKKIRNKIENTKGNYNPLYAYIKLYKSQLQMMVMFVGVCFILFVVIYVGGVHEDTFTKKKKFVIVSQKYQKTMDKILREMIFLQLCGTLTPSQQTSSTFRQRIQSLQQDLATITKRKYKIILVPTKQHIVTVLPESILISKNIVLAPGYKQKDFINLLLLMEALFMQRLHIKQLALSNVSLFLSAKFVPSPQIDIKLSSIYSRKYSNEQIDKTMTEMGKFYEIPLQNLRQEFEKAYQVIKNQVFKQQSPFSLLNRFQSINQVLK